MKKYGIGIVLGVVGMFLPLQDAGACTGISLKARDGSPVYARTIEWGGSNLNSQYVIVPRGYQSEAYAPDGKGGMHLTARYGYVGLAVEQKDFVAEGRSFRVESDSNMAGMLPVKDIFERVYEPEDGGSIHPF